MPTKGISTTSGSRSTAISAGRDHVIVERLRSAGAILLGKTNTPEFAVGAQTFNPIFGATRNPYDLSKTSGGSSGGAAAAVASGMLPFADGSDLGSSLRNPGSFCNVVGFRPTPGRVPNWPFPNSWDTLWSIGPIALTVEDAARYCSKRCRPDRACQIRTPKREAPRGRVARSVRKVRVAWSPDLGGAFPVDDRVTRALEPASACSRRSAASSRKLRPTLGMPTSLQVQRAVGFVEAYGDIVKPTLVMKDTGIWNIEEGSS